MAKRKNDVFLNVRAIQVLEDPDVPNMRGPEIGDTTELQESIKIRGVEEPLWVRPGAEPDTYYLIDGHRRLAAARIIKLKEIPILIKSVDADQGVELMLTADMREKQPHVVIDAEGEVVGGLCWAFHYELEQGKRQIDIAAARGVTADVIGAYNSLFSDLPEMKKAVASGRMAITVYSLIKHSPEPFKKYLLLKKKLSARTVRKEIREWPITEAKLERASARGDDEKPIVGQDKEVELPIAEMPTASHINGAYINILEITDRELEPTDRLLIDRLMDLLRSIQEKG